MLNSLLFNDYWFSVDNTKKTYTSSGHHACNVRFTVD